MVVGKWVRCIKTLPMTFKKGTLYRVYRNPSPGKVVLIDELGYEIGFYTENNDFFPQHFRFVYSQKRGTIWAIQRQQ